ncbi:hypothetical protein BDK51DRAFT_28351, partial [Blyttiomyces helicus]
MLAYDPDLDMKETTVSVNLRSFTLGGLVASTAGEDLAAFAKVPESMVYVDVANSVTKLYVNASDACFEHRELALPVPVRAVVVIDSVKLSSTIIPDSPTVGAKLVVHNATMHLLEEASGPAAEHVRAAAEAACLGGYTNVRKFWKALGFASMVTSDYLELQLRVNGGDISPKFELDLTNHQIYVDVCADSFVTLLTLGAALGEARGGAKQRAENPTRKKGKHPEAVFEDVLGSLDEDAFKQQTVAPIDSFRLSSSSLDEDPDLSSSRLMFEDDFCGPEDDPSLAVDVPEPIVRVLADSFDIVEDHFAVGVTLVEAASAPVRGLETGQNEEAGSTEECTTRIIVRDFDIAIRIYDGYDWERSRQDKAQSASQPPRARSSEPRPAASQSASAFDPDAASEASDDLPAFDMGHSPPFLPTLHGIGRSPVDDSPAAAWDRDSDDGSVRSAASSGWRSPMTQTPPSTFTRPRQPPTHPITTSDLARSQESRIDIKLFSLALSYETHPPPSIVASRLAVSVRDLEVIDNVRTSLWRKFLSHRRPDADDVPRETRSNMVKVEIASVRPDARDPENEELRLKLRLLPLRMYVDQDALSCLIRFFSYESPDKMPAPSTEAKNEAFIQLAEIQAISVKIDYKPKH